jgi:hypothetical protein
MRQETNKITRETSKLQMKKNVGTRDELRAKEMG